jgi:predicted  nucleic acid-binding Zn-ribbon protein
MQKDLKQIKGTLDDVLTKVTTIVANAASSQTQVAALTVQLNDAQSQISALKEQLATAIANADDPTDLQSISDAADALEAKVNSAIGTTSNISQSVNTVANGLQGTTAGDTTQEQASTADTASTGTGTGAAQADPNP